MSSAALDRDPSTPGCDWTEADFLAALRGLRATRGMSVRTLGLRSDVASSTVGGYLSGRHLPAHDPSFDRVLVALGVEDDDLRARWRATARCLAVARRARARAARPDST